MIQKSKFSFIRALLRQANANGLRLDKRNQQLQYSISTHQFITWQKEEDFQHYIYFTVQRLQKRSFAAYKKAS